MTLRTAMLTSQLKDMDTRELYYALDHNLRFNAISFIPTKDADTDKYFQEELEIFSAEYFERGKEIDFFRIVENFAKNHKISPLFAFNSVFYTVIAKAFNNAIYWAKTDSDEYRELVSLLTGVCWSATDTAGYLSGGFAEHVLGDVTPDLEHSWYLSSRALSSYHRELLDAYLENLTPHGLLTTTPVLAHILHEFYTRRALLSSQLRIDSSDFAVYYSCYIRAKRKIIQHVGKTVEKIMEMPSYYPMVKSLDEKVLDIFGLKNRL